jgi:drug/metabolite transporter (DMT)-like permease
MIFFTPDRQGPIMNHSAAMPIPHHRAQDIAAGIAWGMGAGAVWGLVFLAPELVRAFPPLWLAAGRYLAYGAISAVMLAPRWRAVVGAMPGRAWLSLAWLALAGNTLYYVLLSTAIQTGGIAMTSLVIGFLPVAVTIVGSRDAHAVPLARLAPSLLLCGGGAVCIGWQALAAPMGGRPVLGLLCAIGALASWSAFAVGNARALTRLHHVSVHDWNLLTGLVTGLQALVLVPLALAIGAQPGAGAPWGRFLAVSLAVAVLASVLGNTMWNRMTRLLPLTMVGQMILFETLFALLYGFAWEGRWPRPLEVAAFALVVASVLSCIRAHRRPALAAQG